MIGIIAPSSKIPKVELQLGVDRIEREGFSVKVHPQCRKSYLFFAGKDEERAEAFFEYAQDPEVSVLWCARGGYGSIRLLPLLEKLASERGVPPRKLLVGYSDATALMEYVRWKWDWSILHGPMPSMRRFSVLEKLDWKALSSWVRGNPTVAPWAKTKLKYWTHPPQVAVKGSLIGGNLTVWNCLTGTPFQCDLKGKFLFFEDVDEGIYRLDRILQHLNLAGRLNGIRGIILGNFQNCRDHSPLVLKALPDRKKLLRTLKAARPGELEPLRKTLPDLKGLRKIFSEVGLQYGIPVAYGLPVGHGPGVSPLPLGAEYRLTPDGVLELIHWDWLKGT